MKKVFDNIAIFQSVVPAVITASANGSSVDTKGYNDGMVQIIAGAIDLTSANETYVFTVEESDDGSTGWVAVSGLTSSVTANNQLKELRLADLNLARKRYLRVVATLGGTTPSFAGAAVLVLGNPMQGPVANAA